MRFHKSAPIQERLYSTELQCMIFFLYFPVSEKSHCKTAENHLPEADQKLDFSNSCWRQIRILTYRMLLQTYRDKVSRVFTEQVVPEETLVQIQSVYI